MLDTLPPAPRRARRQLTSRGRRLHADSRGGSLATRLRSLVAEDVATIDRGTGRRAGGSGGLSLHLVRMGRAFARQSRVLHRARAAPRVRTHYPHRTVLRPPRGRAAPSRQRTLDRDLPPLRRRSARPLAAQSAGRGAGTPNRILPRRLAATSRRRPAPARAPETQTPLTTPERRRTHRSGGAHRRPPTGRHRAHNPARNGPQRPPTPRRTANTIRTLSSTDFNGWRPIDDLLQIRPNHDLSQKS